MYTDKKYIVYENDTPIIWCQSTVDAGTLAELLNSLTERLAALEAENAQLKRDLVNALDELNRYWNLLNQAHAERDNARFTLGMALKPGVADTTTTAVDVNPALPQEEA